MRAGHRDEISATMPLVAITLLALTPLPPLGGQDVPRHEYATRREAVLDRLADGIVFVHARSSPKAEAEPSFVQDASFYYLTGLLDQPGAILALDGPQRDAVLFVAPPPLSFGSRVRDVVLEPGPASAKRHGLDRVESWDRFEPFVQGRIAAGVRRLYVDEAREPEPVGAPASMWPVAGATTLWRRSVEDAFPDARVESARPVIRELRWIKSRAEIAILRRNARATVAALFAGMRRVGPGVTQREAEVAVVSGCFEAGAVGPSFWPWMMSGPNGHNDRLVGAFYDYRHLNRTMQAGELVRVDIGCASGGYGADVGRTIPVSRYFDAAQRETWNLLVAAYRAGLEAVKPGAPLTQVGVAARAEVMRREPSLVTEAARAAASLLRDNESVWHIHGVGIESGETPESVFRKGAVFALEPGLAVGADAYYLEDMIVVTSDGYEVLSAGLPYTAEEIETAMAPGP